MKRKDGRDSFTGGSVEALPLQLLLLRLNLIHREFLNGLSSILFCGKGKVSPRSQCN